MSNIGDTPSTLDTFEKGRSLWQDAFARLRKNKLAMFGLIVIIFMVIIAIMMRMVDVLYALPFAIFIILLTVVFGRSLLLLFLAIGAVEWLTMARIVRGQVLSLKQQEFIEAAVAMGLSRWQIMRRHLIPNVLGPIIVYTTLTIPSVILLESFLSFLGLGIQPPQSSWGSLISYGVETMEEYPWLLVFPGLTLSITLLSLNFLGDGLRDAMHPRTSRD